MPDNHPTPDPVAREMIERRNDIIQHREELVEDFIETYQVLHPEASTEFIKSKLDRMTKNLANYVVGKFTYVDYKI